MQVADLYQKKLGTQNVQIVNSSGAEAQQDGVSPNHRLPSCPQSRRSHQYYLIRFNPDASPAKRPYSDLSGFSFSRYYFLEYGFVPEFEIVIRDGELEESYLRSTKIIPASCNPHFRISQAEISGV
ncbi:MAG: hypothetical protein HC880_11210 [Bacteroidia bacterium]|nr:hypothetical protein [Bacteroidia bacterium]